MGSENKQPENYDEVDPKAVTRPLKAAPADPAFQQTDRLDPQPPAPKPPAEDPPAEVVEAIFEGAAGGGPFIQVAQRSDIGVVRQRNEDACFSFVGQSGGSTPLIPFAVGLVADGMGGHVNGHEASRKVADQIASYVLERVYMPLLKGRPAPKSLQELMEEAVAAANQAIFTPDPDQEGGTTLTGALIVGRRLYIIHVGDTRAYLIFDDKLELLTTDHSIVKRMEEAGQITAEQAAHHPHRNLLYRALTGNELEVDTYTRSLPKAGYLFICSDGLWDSIEERDLQLIILNPHLSLQERCETLVQLALTNGSQDNVTGVLVEFRTG